MKVVEYPEAFEMSEKPCGRTYRSTDVDLWERMPRRHRNLLPFKLEYITKGSDFVFGKELTSKADFDMVTYSGGDPVMRQLEVTYAETYEEHRCDWYEHVHDYCQARGEDQDNFPDFPPFCEWIGRAEGVCSVHCRHNHAIFTG